MNKKSRLLLPTIGLVVLSAIAATSTTFAWFTTVRSASVEVTRAKVVTTDSNLMIEHAHTWNDPAVLVPDEDGGGDDPIVLTYTGDALITDISGDGKTFFKPVWAVAPSQAANIRNVTPVVVGDADGYLIDFTIRIFRSDADGVEGLKVYLGSGTEFTPITAQDGDAVQLAKDEQAIAGARMSVYEADEDGVLGNVIYVHSPVEEVGAKNSVYLGEYDDTAAHGSTDAQLYDDLDVLHAPFATAATNAAASAVYAPIAYLVGAEEPVAANRVDEAFVNFRIWIEGEDSDTVNSMIDGEFEVNLDLYALPHNA